jgi:hypothetical protein
MRIRIEGFFPQKVTKEKQTILPRYQDNLVLDSETYTHSIKEFSLEDLEVMPLTRYWGSCIFGIPLVAVVDTKGLELSPFFIRKQKSLVLKQRIESLKGRPYRL